MTAYNYGWKPPTAAQREAQRVFKETDAKVAMSEYERIQAAFHANRERLKAERLAREAEAAADDDPVVLAVGAVFAAIRVFANKHKMFPPMAVDAFRLDRFEESTA